MEEKQDMQNAVIETKYIRGLINDTNALRANFGNLDNIIRDILVYLSNKQNKDIFGFSTIDVDEFCDEMNYTRNNLRKKANIQKLIPALYEGYEWQNYFEYTLLVMLRLNMVLSAESKGAIHLESYQLLSKIVVEKGLRGKRMYKVKLGYFTNTSWFKDYVNIDYESYKQIQKNQNNQRSSFMNLYLFLMKTYSSLVYRNESSLDISIDSLSKVMNYEITDDNHRKRKQQIKKGLELLLPLMANVGFSYEFVPATSKSRFNYNINLQFNKAINFISDKELHQFKVTYRNACEIFYLKEKQIDFYNKNKESSYEYSPLKKDIEIPEDIAIHFSKWFSSKEDANLKADVYWYMVGKFFKNLANFHNKVKVKDKFITIIGGNYDDPLKTLYIDSKREEERLIEEKKKEEFSLKSEEEKRRIFHQLVVKNNINEIMELVESNNAFFHKDYIYLNLAFDHRNYNVCQYLISKGTYVSKEFMDNLEKRKDKESKALLNFICEYKNK